jgi:hypothetical protein
MNNNYLLVIRNNAGAYLEKVTVQTNLEQCREILQVMLYANKNANRAEIIEGNRDYIGDFRVKPIEKFGINLHRTLVRETDENDKN